MRKKKNDGNNDGDGEERNVVANDDIEGIGGSDGDINDDKNGSEKHASADDNECNPIEATNSER